MKTLKLKPHEHDALAKAPARPQATRILIRGTEPKRNPFWAALARIFG